MMVGDEISWIKVHTRAEVEAMSEGAKVDLILALESRLCALEPRVRELEARTRWLHVVATPELTLYHVDDKRGQQAMEAHGVLAQFTGRLVHDCWAPYFAYEGCAIRRALCRCVTKCNLVTSTKLGNEYDPALLKPGMTAHRMRLRAAPHALRAQPMRSAWPDRN